MAAFIDGIYLAQIELDAGPIESKDKTETKTASCCLLRGSFARLVFGRTFGILGGDLQQQLNFGSILLTEKGKLEGIGHIFRRNNQHNPVFQIGEYFFKWKNCENNTLFDLILV